MQMNFDPMTGEPINQNNGNVNNTVVLNQVQPESVKQTTAQIVQPTPVTVESEQNITSNTINAQQQMQSIPTVEQSKQEFINNTQENNTIKKDEKKEGPNVAFILILFAIIFAAIFFLFPYLLEVL